MTHLIVGLGNIGAEYAETRHNIGFKVLDALAKASNLVFEEKRYGEVAEMRLKNKQLLLLKPSTYMNLSGNAVRYWISQKKIDIDNVLIIVDDLAIPFGEIRLKPSGSEAGHNGLKSITECLGTQRYPRLRFGIGSDFPKGGQIDYVLGSFSDQELLTIDQRITQAVEAIKAFALSGITFAMNHFNGSK